MVCAVAAVHLAALIGDEEVEAVDARAGDDAIDLVFDLRLVVGVRIGIGGDRGGAGDDAGNRKSLEGLAEHGRRSV